MVKWLKSKLFHLYLNSINWIKQTYGLDEYEPSILYKIYLILKTIRMY